MKGSDKNSLSDMDFLDQEISEVKRKIGELKFSLHEMEMEKNIIDLEILKLLDKLTDLLEERQRKIS